MANTAFLNYFDELINTLDTPCFHNITRQEHILPISLESDDFNKELLSAPETLRELVERYKQRKLTSGSIHLFKLTGDINRENITLHKNTFWDIMEIGWRPVTITLNGNVINLPGSVIIPFRDKFKIRWMMKSRPLLLHLMLKQGQTWYPLSNIREMMEIENNIPHLVEMHIEP